MDFQFYQVEEDLNHNINYFILSEEKRVFKSRRLDKSIYKLKKNPKEQFFDLCYFLNERVEEEKNNKQNRYNYNKFTIDIIFLNPNGNDKDIRLCSVHFNVNGFNENGFYNIFTDELLLERSIYLYGKNFYEIVITEILNFFLPQDIDSNTDYGEEEEITPPHN